ncbi:MAG: hypothetical protein M3P04_11685 [Actinomycetota bacterium]|nr:hypothetical protein [Actinomycetota bacterium]
MRSRLILAPVLVGALALMSSGAGAATKTLDGKKVKKLTITASGGAQANDADLVTGLLDAPDRTDCAMPRCARLTFKYLPAKGVKGDLMFSVNWANPLSDIDLYVGEIAKDGSSTEIGHCAGFGTTSEKLFIPKSQLKSGKQYVLVVDFFRSLNETATGTVQIGVPNTIKTTVPTSVDGQVQNINCTL